MSNRGYWEICAAERTINQLSGGRFDDKDLTAVKDIQGLRFLQLSSNTRLAINRSRRSSWAEPATSSASHPSSCHQLKPIIAQVHFLEEHQGQRSPSTQPSPLLYIFPSVNLWLFNIEKHSNTQASSFTKIPLTQVLTHILKSLRNGKVFLPLQNLRLFLYFKIRLSKPPFVILICYSSDINRPLFRLWRLQISLPNLILRSRELSCHCPTWPHLWTPRFICSVTNSRPQLPFRARSTTWSHRQPIC